LPTKKKTRKKAGPNDKRHSNTGKGKRPTPPTGLEIKLGNVDECLATLESLLRLFERNKMKRQKFTALIYGINSFVGIHKMKAEEQLKETIEEVKKEVAQIRQERALQAPGYSRRR
jgi:hypothetical protein